MKKQIFYRNAQIQLFLLGAIVFALLSFSCGVVVPSFAPATEFGFNLSGDYDVQEPYTVGALQCKTELYPNILFPTEDNSASAAYIAVLKNAFPAWTFNNSTTKLSDDAIEIKTYDAIGTSTMVGVWIHARYVPHGSDPTDDIHWVQVLTTNHGLKGTGHGPSATYLDIHSSATTPYYDDGYAADSRDLIDRPWRSDASSNHTWEATTFLVTGPDVGDGAGTVTLLSPGFTWGWKNTCTMTDGLEEFFFYQEEPEVVQLSTKPRIGGRLQLVSEQPGSLILGKEDNQAKVPVLSKSISFSIEKEADIWGTATLQNGKGEIKFGAYEFEGKSMAPVSAEITLGSGFFHTDTGEASIEYLVSVPLPDGTTEDIVFTGTGLYNQETGTFTLNADLQGISETFRKSNVPKDTRKNKDK